MPLSVSVGYSLKIQSLSRNKFRNMLYAVDCVIVSVFSV